jgi:hypothetical protein
LIVQNNSVDYDKYNYLLVITKLFKRLKQIYGKLYLLGKDEIDAAQTVEERKKIFRHLIKDLKAQDATKDIKPKKDEAKTPAKKT